MNKNFIYFMNVATVIFLGWALGSIGVLFFKGNVELSVINLVSIIIMMWCLYTKAIIVLHGTERRIQKLDSLLKRVEFEVRIK